MNLNAYLAPGVLALALAACATPSPPLVNALPLPARDTLFEPDRVQPGRLAYAPDRSTFAPVLTERFAYPTQIQANNAYRRLLGDEPVSAQRQTSIWLFGCKPGALDAQTARINRYRGPVVHCATDVLSADGRRLSRETVNFYHYRSVWNMQPVDPPRLPVPWRVRERSPQDPWHWVPGRDRYE
jgi:hypothetical protein